MKLKTVATMTENEFYKTPIKKLAQSFSLKNGKLDLVFYSAYIIKGKTTTVYTPDDIIEMEIEPKKKIIIKKKGTYRDIFSNEEPILIKDIIDYFYTEGDDFVMVIKPKIFIGEKYNNMLCYEEKAIIDMIMDTNIPVLNDEVIPSI